MNLRSAAARLGGVVSGGRIRCPAPGKGRKNRSLSVKFNADGTFHATDFSGGDWRVARDHVKAVLGLSDDKPVAFRVPAPRVDPERLGNQKTAADIWAKSVPIAGTLAETYLASRGLSYDGDALRFYPGGRAMVGLINDAITGEAIGIHRTFLDHVGRAVLMSDGRKKKLMLGAAAGGVVRLREWLTSDKSIACRSFQQMRRSTTSRAIIASSDADIALLPPGIDRIEPGTRLAFETI